MDRLLRRLRAESRGPYMLITAALLALAFARPVGAEAVAQPAVVAATSADWCHGPRPAAFSRLERVPTAQDWFEVYRVRPDTFAIYEPKQYEHVISYLLVGAERALLFDSGLGIGHMSTLVRELSSKPVTVLNSHTHFDHVGGNAEFEDVWNTDMPFSRDSARGGLDDYGRATLEPDRLCGELPADVAPGAYTLRPWRVTHRVRDGERIDLGSRVLEVIFTPGHSPDSLVLLDRAHGLLFTGDTYYSGPIYLFARGTDFEAYARSVAQLAGLVPGLERLLPAHEVPDAEPAQLLALERAVEQVRAGKLEPVAMDETLEYRFDGFSLLLAR